MIATEIFSEYKSFSKYKIYLFKVYIGHDLKYVPCSFSSTHENSKIGKVTDFSSFLFCGRITLNYSIGKVNWENQSPTNVKTYKAK